jgi:hypothetical protein
MKNLESFGVQELDAKEKVTLEGGNPIFEWIIDEVISWVDDNGIQFSDPNPHGMYLI